MTIRKSKWFDVSSDRWIDDGVEYAIAVYKGGDTIGEGKAGKQYTVALDSGSTVKLEAPNPPFGTEEQTE